MGGRGGGGMIRRLGRSVGGGGGVLTRANTKATNGVLSVSTAGGSTSSSAASASSVTVNAPVSATYASIGPASPLPTWHGGLYDSDVWEWESVDGSAQDDDDDEQKTRFYDRFVFGPVPSLDEAHHAVSALQHFISPYTPFFEDVPSSGSDIDSMNQISSPSSSLHKSDESESDWIEPSLYVHNSTMQLSQGFERARVYDAFHLLNNPSVKRTVVSLSTDRAVWEAIMNNDEVRQLRDKYAEYAEAEKNNPENRDQNPDAAAKSVLSWIMDNSKAKILELIESITKLLGELFKRTEQDKPATTGDGFQETLKSSLMLSIIVFIIVVVTRAHRP